MEKPGIITIAISLLSGLVIGGAVVVLYFYANGMIEARPLPLNAEKITQEEAKTLIRQYKNSNQDKLSFNAIKIDKEQLGAINSLVINPEMKSYRVYFGLVRQGDTCCIILGADEKGLNLWESTIYKTRKGTFDPCPPICDNSNE